MFSMGPVLILGQKAELDNPCSQDASDINSRRQIVCVPEGNRRGEEEEQR